MLQYVVCNVFPRITRKQCRTLLKKMPSTSLIGGLGDFPGFLPAYFACSPNRRISGRWSAFKQRAPDLWIVTLFRLNVFPCPCLLCSSNKERRELRDSLTRELLFVAIMQLMVTEEYEDISKFRVSRCQLYLYRAWYFLTVERGNVINRNLTFHRLSFDKCASNGLRFGGQRNEFCHCRPIQKENLICPQNWRKTSDVQVQRPPSLHIICSLENILTLISVGNTCLSTEEDHDVWGDIVPRFYILWGRSDCVEERAGCWWCPCLPTHTHTHTHKHTNRTHLDLKRGEMATVAVSVVVHKHTNTHTHTHTHTYTHTHTHTGHSWCGFSWGANFLRQWCVYVYVCVCVRVCVCVCVFVCVFVCVCVSSLTRQ
jgi:hypothetical protein